MDGFSYVDIFATKGVEYLVVIAFLALLVPFWLVLNKKAKITLQIRKAYDALSFKMVKIPQGLFYGKNHTWMYLEKSGVAKIGADDLLMHLTGEVRCSFPKNPGELIRRGDLITTLNQDGKVLRLLSPVSGKVTEVNTALTRNPALLNNDPYGNGWIYKVKPSDWISEAKSCYFAEVATAWSAKDLERIKDFLAVAGRNYYPDSSAVILQDGGELRDHTLSTLSAPVWKAFEQEFLDLPAD